MHATPEKAGTSRGKTGTDVEIQTFVLIDLSDIHYQSDRDDDIQSSTTISSSQSDADLSDIESVVSSSTDSDIDLTDSSLFSDDSEKENLSRNNSTPL